MPIEIKNPFLAQQQGQPSAAQQAQRGFAQGLQAAQQRRAQQMQQQQFEAEQRLQHQRLQAQAMQEAGKLTNANPELAKEIVGFFRDKLPPGGAELLTKQASLALKAQKQQGLGNQIFNESTGKPGPAAELLSAARGGDPQAAQDFEAIRKEFEAAFPNRQGEIGNRLQAASGTVRVQQAREDKKAATASSRVLSRELERERRKLERDKSDPVKQLGVARAEALLAVANGTQTEDQRRLLDELSRLDPFQALQRDFIQNILGAATAGSGGAPITQGDVDAMVAEVQAEHPNWDRDRVINEAKRRLRDKGGATD